MPVPVESSSTVLALSALSAHREIGHSLQRRAPRKWNLLAQDSPSGKIAPLRTREPRRLPRGHRDFVPHLTYPPAPRLDAVHIFSPQALVSTLREG